MPLSRSSQITAVRKKRAISMTLNAYYFRHHMYTLVPRHVRDDMAWMRDIGTEIVSLAILEQDLYAARENVDIICDEASRAGMKVYAVPSRWGGLVAGAPKVPSFFAASHPETWILQGDGTPLFSSVSGPMCSVHHPATREFFHSHLSVVLQQWPISGVVWDEPKTLATPDFSPPALEKLGAQAPLEAHTEAVARFFDDVGHDARQISGSVQLGMFLQCNAGQDDLERCARIENLDDFGCDGRPWRISDGGVAEAKNKMLLGGAQQRRETCLRRLGSIQSAQADFVFLRRIHSLPFESALAAAKQQTGLCAGHCAFNSGVGFAKDWPLDATLSISRFVAAEPRNQGSFPRI